MWSSTHYRTGVCVLLSLLAVCSAQPSCIFNTPVATFDLSPLRLPALSVGYTVHDSSDDAVARNFSYVFNVCSSVGRLPAPACAEPSADIAPAYQVSSDKQQCHRLGNSARTPTDAQWSLLDQTDPARGVALTYLNGEKCSGTNQARQLTLRFECASSSSSTGNVFTEPVRETKTCQYELNIASVFGCPRECPLGSNRQLCSAHGICAFDSDQGVPRCFCDTGFLGPDCSASINDPDAPQTDDPNQVGSGIGVMGVALIIACVILLVMLVASWLLYLRIGRMKSAADAEQAMREMGVIGTAMSLITDTADDLDAQRDRLEQITIQAAAPTLFSIAGDDDDDSSDSQGAIDVTASSRNRKAYSSTSLLQENQWPAPVISPSVALESTSRLGASIAYQTVHVDDGDQTPRYMGADADDLLSENENNKRVYSGPLP